MRRRDATLKSTVVNPSSCQLGSPGFRLRSIYRVECQAVDNLRRGCGSDDRRLKLPRGRPVLRTSRQRVAQDRIEADQKFAHHRNHDDLARLAAGAQASQKALISGSQRMAVRAGLNRITLTALRPGARPRRFVAVPPLWWTRGARPASAVISLRSSRPSSGSSASRDARGRLRHALVRAQHRLLEGEARGRLSSCAAELGLDRGKLPLPAGAIMRSIEARTGSTAAVSHRHCSACKAAVSWRRRVMQRIEHARPGRVRAAAYRRSGDRARSLAAAGHRCASVLALMPCDLAERLDARRLHDCPRNTCRRQRRLQWPFVAAAALEHHQVARRIEACHQNRDRMAPHWHAARPSSSPSRATSSQRLPISTPITRLPSMPTSVMLAGSGPST